MKEGDYEGEYLGGWRGRAARLQKPPPRVRADSGKSAGVGGHVTSHPAGGASHLSPGMGTATSLLRRRANPPRTLGREEVGQGEPAPPAPAHLRQPLGAERVGRAQACTPGLDSGGVGSPRRPRQHPPPLVLAPDGGASHCSPPTLGLASGRTDHELRVVTSSRHPHPAPGSCRGRGSRRGHTRGPHAKHPEKDVGPRFKAHCQLCQSESDGPKTSLLTGVLQGVPRGRSGELDPQPGSRGQSPLAPAPHPGSRAPPP